MSALSISSQSKQLQILSSCSPNYKKLPTSPPKPSYGPKPDCKIWKKKKIITTLSCAKFKIWRTMKLYQNNINGKKTKKLNTFRTSTVHFLSFTQLNKIKIFFNHTWRNSIYNKSPKSHWPIEAIFPCVSFSLLRPRQIGDTDWMQMKGSHTGLPHKPTFHHCQQ